MNNARRLSVVLRSFTAHARVGARELETRSRREETMRNLRWAAELAVREDERTAILGAMQLIALLESDLLDDREKVFVEAALDAVFEDPETDLSDADGDDGVVLAEETGAERSGEVSW